MKKYLLLVLIGTLLFFHAVIAQQTTQYVAAKAGLSLREKPSVTAAVLEKIPYGTKISFAEDTAQWVTIITENINGFWRKVNYNNKTGYVADCFLFPAPPPKAGITNLKAYLAQLSIPFGNKLVVKSDPDNLMNEGGWEIQKQLYKNGSEWHHYMGYEYGSNTYFIPDFTIQQAFILLRLLPEFKEVVDASTIFPLEDKTFKKGEQEYSIKVEKEVYGDGYPWIKRISIEYEDGAIYNLELYMQDAQVVVLFGSGV